MRTKFLSEICKPKQWKNLPISSLSEDGFPVYGANGIIGYYDVFNHEKPTIAITCRGATCGNIHITKERSYITSNAMALDELDTSAADLNYLANYLKYRGLNDVTTGAAQPQITRGNLEKIQIPLPPLDDQKRIAHLLGKVEGMIARRKQHLQQLDELLKSVFLEMFGDPVRNEKGWDFPAIDKFGIISTGNTPPRKDVENYTPGFIEWIKTDNIPADSANISTAEEMLSEKGAQKGRIVNKGALLVACIAGSVESIGRAALSDKTVAFNQQINAIQPYEDVDSYFLYALFKICKTYVQSHATKGMKKILTKGDFVKIKMIKPPFELQNKFATIASKVESLKSRYQSSLSNLENLFGALSQMAFKGVLDLGRVSLPVEEKTAKPEEVPVLPFDEGLSEAMKKTLADLNSFNNSSASLRALQEAASINFNSSAMEAAKILAEQARLWKNPLDELKNMSSVARAMEELVKPSAIQQIAKEQIEAFQHTSKLAQQLAASMPKIDTSIIEQQRKLMESATRPFMEMQMTLANFNLTRTTLSEAIDDSEAVARRFQTAIPDYSSWQQQYNSPEGIDAETEEEEEPKHIFTRYDITDVLTATAGLTFEDLSVKLTDIEVSICHPMNESEIFFLKCWAKEF